MAPMGKTISAEVMTEMSAEVMSAEVTATKAMTTKMSAEVTATEVMAAAEMASTVTAAEMTTTVAPTEAPGGGRRRSECSHPCNGDGDNERRFHFYSPDQRTRSSLH